MPQDASTIDAVQVPTLETERLRLRRFKTADITEYLAIFSHPEVGKFLPPLQTRAEAYRQMAMIEGNWHLVGMSMFGVVEKATGQMIGRVGPWMPDERPEPEIGWVIHPDKGGRGYATEAAIVCRDYLFARFSTLTRVVHHIVANNIASQKTATRIGAVLTDEIYHHPIAGPCEIWASYHRERD